MNVEFGRGEATFGDSEGRELAHIEVEDVESRDGALHINGYFVPPRIVDGDVLGPVVRDPLPTEAAAQRDSGIWIAIEAEILPAGSSMHWPYCNDGRCPGCIPQEIVDDCVPLGEHVQRLLSEGLRDMHERYDDVMWSWQDDNPVPRQGGKGAGSAHMIIDEWTGPRAYPIEDEDGAPSRYDLDRFAWMYRYRLTSDTLRWSDIQIKGLGIS